MLYDRGTAALIQLMQERSDLTGFASVPRVLLAILSLSPAESVLSEEFRHEEVFPEVGRHRLRRYAVGQEQLTLSNSFTVDLLIHHLVGIAHGEQAPIVTEWHVAKLLAREDAPIMRNLGINAEQFLERVAVRVGIAQVTEQDKAKTWCVCDTNLFIQYAMFDEVEWNLALGVGPVVLVVPMSVVRELDDFKFNERDRQRKRARQVLPRLGCHAFAQVPGQPDRVRDNVELLVWGLEPRAFPQGLDPTLIDDRIVATALEFRWTHPGVRVVLLSGDLTPRVKAHWFGLESLAIPDDLLIPSQQSP